MQQLGTRYQHEYASLARIQYFMDQGQAVCVPNKLKTSERASKYIFSYPVNLYLSHLLYQLATNQALAPEVLTEEGELKSLNSLFTDFPSKTILLPFKRSFGPMLDKQIALLPDVNKLIYQGGDLHESEIEMFIKQRGDFLLTYPATIFANKKSFGDIAIRGYAIANNPKYTNSRIMCADTPATRTHIEQINQALHVLYAQPELLDIHLKWAHPAAHEQIKTYYQQVTQEFRQTLQ